MPAGRRNSPGPGRPWGSEDAGTPGRLETPRGPAVAVPALREVLGGQQPALPRSPAWLRFVSHRRCPRCPNTPPTSQGRTTWTWCPSLGETSLEGEGRAEQEASGTARRLGTARPRGNTRLPRRPSRRQEQEPEPEQCLGPRPEYQTRPRLNRADEEPPLLRQPGSCLCPAGAGGSSEVGPGSVEPPPPAHKWCREMGVLGCPSARRAPGGASGTGREERSRPLALTARAASARQCHGHRARGSSEPGPRKAAAPPPGQQPRTGESE